MVPSGGEDGLKAGGGGFICVCVRMHTKTLFLEMIWDSIKNDSKVSVS